MEITTETPEKFLLEQYKGLIIQIEKLLHETDELAKYALIGTVSVWTWLATEIPDKFDHIQLIWWLPLGLVFVLGVRVMFLTKLVIEIGAFIVKIDVFTDLPKELSWEQHVENQRQSKRFVKRNSNRALSAVAYWLLLYISTIIVPLWINGCCFLFSLLVFILLFGVAILILFYFLKSSNNTDNPIKQKND